MKEVHKQKLTLIFRPETNENLQDVESIFNDGTDDFSYFNQGFFIFDQPEEYKRAVRPLLMEDRVLAVEQKVKKHCYKVSNATNANPRSSSATERRRRR